MLATNQLYHWDSIEAVAIACFNQEPESAEKFMNQLVFGNPVYASIVLSYRKNMHGTTNRGYMVRGRLELCW